VGIRQGFEEALFLGLRLVSGVSVSALQSEFGSLAGEIDGVVAELEEGGLMTRQGDRVGLTAAGRMISNEVFERLLLTDAPAGGP
jgi:oxygen-independent coproporphyrinogen-3 oxidase